MEKNTEALGIPSTGIEYLQLLHSNKGLEDKIYEQVQEFNKIKNFLSQVANSNTIPEFQGAHKKLQFINYGSTELVYVLTVGTKKYTLLIGQPITPFGAVKKEYENLKFLGSANREHIVTPMYYMQDKNMQKELYVTPYLYQARCIGVEKTDWGMWVPEPEYHFTNFSPEERKVINSSMIALLVKCFDSQNNLGIGSCRLTGGDFMLEKGFEDEPITHENILKKMKLIAARELIPMTIEEYTKRLREEFTKTTFYRRERDKNKSILINDKARSPMSSTEIEMGIELGLQLRERSKQIEK